MVIDNNVKLIILPSVSEGIDSVVVAIVNCWVAVSADVVVIVVASAIDVLDVRRTNEIIQ